MVDISPSPDGPNWPGKVLNAPVLGPNPPPVSTELSVANGSPSPLTQAENRLIKDGLYGDLRQAQVKVRLELVQKAMEKPSQSKGSLIQRIKNYFRL